MLTEKIILSIQELDSVKAQEIKTFLISDVWTVVDESNYQEDRYGNTIYAALYEDVEVRW